MSKERRRQRRNQKKGIVAPNGADSIVNPSTVSQRAARLSELIAAYPHKIAYDLAMRDDAGWVFGRLFLVGAIDHDQKIAAERLGRAVHNYHRLLHRHYGPKVSNPSFEVGQATGEDLSKQAEKKLRRAIQEYERVVGVLRLCGDKVERDILQALEIDSLTDLDSVRLGLEALSKTFPRNW